jgi:hypothetical protein
MHYFGLNTETTTAFNEGFATHFQRVAIKNEPNKNRKSKILKDIKSNSKDLKQKINGYEKDYKWSFRLEYYRLSMLSWYQKLEGIKRVQDKKRRHY